MKRVNILVLDTVTHCISYFRFVVCPVDMETTYDGSSPALTIADSSPSSSNSQPEDALRPSGGNNWEPSTPLPEPYLTVTIPSDGNHPLMEITVTVIKVSKINVRIPGKDSKVSVSNALTNEIVTPCLV